MKRQRLRLLPFALKSSTMCKKLILPHFIILGLFGPLVLVCQTRNATPPKSNPYSRLSDKELTARTTEFMKGLRSLNKEFRKITDGISAGDRDADSKLRPIDAIQRDYERKFAAEARDIESELLRRLPSGAKPKDVPSQIAAMLIKSGKLIGADPPEAIASYLEELTMRLQKAPAPRN